MSRQLDDRLYRKMERLVRRLVHTGLTQEAALRQVMTTFGQVLDAGAENMFSDLKATADEHLAHERLLWREAQAALRAQWSEALDVYYLTVYGIAEAADRYIDRHAAGAAARQDDTFRALAFLHQRGRRIAWEIFALLSSGFPHGAIARARTLHELAVIGAVIGEYGRRPATADLANRFFDYVVIEELRAHDGGYSDFVADESYVNELRQRAEALTDQYGSPFAERNGWAAILNGDEAPSFAKLEALVEMEGLRGEYQRMSGEVHAGAAGLVLNMSALNPDEALIGPTMVGLGEPGQLALLNLHRLTWAFLVFGSPNDRTRIQELLSLRVLERFIDWYTELANEVEMRVATDSEAGASTVG